MAIAFSYTEATNTVVVTGGTSGTPATFADFVTADRAGVDTILLSAGSPASDLALTYAVRPVEDLAILVKCVVANKTAEADFIFITGKDWRGAAQTESIDVTAGNGSYTTTKYWSEITSLDCSDNAAGGGIVWADGDLSVTQDVWGVIWDYGNGQYRVDDRLYIGDDSTPTYFKTSSEEIVFTYGSNTAFRINASATYQDGDKINDSGANGSKIKFINTSNTYTVTSNNTATWKLYGTEISFDTSKRFQLYGDIDFRDVRFSGMMLYIKPTTITWKDITCEGTSYVLLTAAPDNAPERLYIRNATNYGYYSSNEAVGIEYTFRGAKISDSNSNDIRFGQNQILHFIDGVFGTFSWVTNAGTFLDEKSCNIHIADKDGVDLAGVTVKCEDKDGTEEWSVNTDANGDIAEQVIIYKKAVDGGALTTYSPHKFTISKAGYETMVLDAVTVDHPIVWHLELLDELAEGDVRNGVAYGEDSEGNLELPAVGDVESGVGFGSNGVEFTGDFEVPAEADVRDGEGYGAGGAEFEGDLDLPAIGDVEKGVQFDSLTKTGTFKSPAEADVRDGSQYGKDDTEFTGTLDLPAEADVEDGVTFDGATKEGNFEAPAEADVEDGVGYGAGGAEFEGNLELPAEEDVEVGVGYGSLGTEFEGTYLGLKGNNLTAVLEKSVALTGHLEKKVSLTGELKS